MKGNKISIKDSKIIIIRSDSGKIIHSFSLSCPGEEDKNNCQIGEFDDYDEV